MTYKKSAPVDVSRFAKAPATRKELTAAKAMFYDELIRDRELTATALRVAWRLLDRLNFERRMAWPSVETLASELTCEPRTIKRAIGQLKDSGWFAVNEGGGSGRASEYAPMLERVTGMSPFDATKGDNPDQKGCQSCPERVTGMSPQPSYNLLRESTDVASRSASPDGLAAVSKKKEGIHGGAESDPVTLRTSEHRDREGALTRFEWTCNGCGARHFTDSPARLKDVEAGELPSSVDCYKCRPVPPDPKPPANGVPVHAGEGLNA